MQESLLKKPTNLLLPFILIIFLCFSSIVSAQTRVNKIIFNKVLRIGVSGNQPPFALESKNNKLIGFEIDLGKRLGSAMGVQVEFVKLPFPELLPALKSNKIDIIMSGMTMTTIRNLNVAFIGPYITTGKSLLTKSNKYANISDVSELDSKKVSIATLAGSTSEEFVKSYIPSAKLVLVNDYEEAINMVRNEEISLMLADYAQCMYASLRYSEDNLQVLNHTLTNERIGMAIPSDDPLFINILQNFLGEIESTGELGELETEWFQSGSWLMLAK